MTDYVFLFDLYSTVTKQEILPTIAKGIGKLDEIRTLTEATMRGEIPFKVSFLNRVSILSSVNVSTVRQIVSQVELNPHIAGFIRENAERCYIVTGNLDIWICDLMKKLGMEHHVYCSKADVKDDKIAQVVSVAEKELIVKQFIRPFVVVGDGDNDSGMARLADIAIGFGGVRDIAPSLLRCVNFAFYDDRRCADFLKTLL